ncbi:MAG TPA: BadF/BadG/BcrA/BcrD ATPase family protein [Cellvibrio sp.]|nr:BadF/BadG/BcrA/BcrD ATPase family protein [Cellvibrio sp.]
MSESSVEQLFLGIDGGGTKCCALIMDAQGAVLGRGLGGAANAYQHLLQAQASIIDATTLALRDAGLPETTMGDLIAGVGLAGVNLPSVFASVQRWQHPFKKMHLTTDLHIACLGAHQAANGAVIISGTGSCGYSIVDNKTTILGGHGFLLGDNGSGAWMGLEAVKAVLLAIDHLGPPTLMQALICDYLQAGNGNLVDKLAAASSGDYAKISRFVLSAAEQKDEIALAILRSGAAYIDALAQALWQAGPGRMSLIGGLSAYLTPWLSSATQANLSAPLAPPEVGAILFARQQTAL